MKPSNCTHQILKAESIDRRQKTPFVTKRVNAAFTAKEEKTTLRLAHIVWSATAPIIVCHPSLPTTDRNNWSACSLFPLAMPLLPCWMPYYARVEQGTGIRLLLIPLLVYLRSLGTTPTACWCHQDWTTPFTKPQSDANISYQSTRLFSFDPSSTNLKAQDQHFTNPKGRHQHYFHSFHIRARTQH